jgi:hypothetical protein
VALVALLREQLVVQLRERPVVLLVVLVVPPVRVLEL